MSDLSKTLKDFWVAVTDAGGDKPSNNARQLDQQVEFIGDYKKLDYAWDSFRNALETAEKALKECKYDPYLALPAKESFWWTPPQQEQGFLTLADIFLLPIEFKRKSLDQLKTPNELPSLPSLPAPLPVRLHPDQYPKWYDKYHEGTTKRREQLIQRANELKTCIEEAQHEFQAVFIRAQQEAETLMESAFHGDTEAQVKAFEFLNQRYPLPLSLRKGYSVAINRESSTVLVQFEFPDYTAEQIIIDYKSSKYGPVAKFATDTKKRKLVKCCLYSSIVRAAYISATIASDFYLETIVINVEQNWFDSATGQHKNGIIASLQAQVDHLINLDLSKLDPEICFKHLKGIATPSLDNVSPIRPILVLDKNDNRFIASKSVDQSMDSEANLATMPWEDFEHLVAQLFEWEFARNGVEIRVTRASRDRGVDAILFDPDPLRGGKYVLQAKRYTKTVDVSSVRDLYGTVMNEGANRGILITTSTYGPDSYEFAKDKPLSLVDGPNLLHMLQKHGKQFRIDLEEARRLNAIGNEMS